MDESVEKKFVSNTSWMIGSKIYSMLVSLIVGSLSARYLGPSNYGILNYGTAIISFFNVISSLGLASTLVVEMVQKSDKIGSYLGTSLFFRFIISIASFIGIVGMVIIIEPGNKQLQIVTALQAISVILNTYEVLLCWFQMKLQMKYVTIASMLALTVTGVWRVLLLANKASIELFALSTSVTALVSGICVIYFFVKDTYPNLCVNVKDGIYLVRNSYHFIISGLAVTLYSQLDRIMLGKMLSSEVVGYYSAAMTIATMWEFVPQALINSSRPVLTELKMKNLEEYEKKYKILLLGISLLGIVVGGGFLVLGKLIIFILYGKSYAPAVPTLQILIWSTSFAMIGTTRVIWTVNENQGHLEKYFTVMGSVVNIILNAIFIPYFGIVGAAITTLVSQVFVGVIAPLFFKESRPFVRLYFESFKECEELYHIISSLVHKKIRYKN